MSNKIWYLPGPFHQYQEDVKALAKEHGLVIIDANVSEGRKGEAKDVPEVTIRPELRPAEPAASSTEDESVVLSLRASLESVGLTIESFVSGELKEFGDSELSVRLYQVLESVSQSFQDLRDELGRETGKAAQLAQENADLLDKLEALKAAGGDVEIEAMKEKLAKAKVPFRANASREALEKLVAELPKE